MRVSESFPPQALQVTLPSSAGVSCVIGAPGSGKTTQLLEVVAKLELSHSPERILVLTPGRTAAATLRDLIALRSKSASATPRARSLSSFAFELVLRESPDLTLLSGPSQQQLLTDLVSEAKGIAGWGINPKATGLQAFSQELRDLIQVLVEFELGSAELEELAIAHPKLKLGPALELLPGYRQFLDQANALDPASLLAKAIGLVRPEYDFVLVDDAQDVSSAGLKLIQALAQNAPVLLFGDPDAAVQGFRAAEPGEFVSLGPTQVISGELPQPMTAQQVMAKIASRISPAGAGRQRSAIRQSASQVTAPVFSSTSAEADHLAARLRRLRLEQGIAFSEMAVVVRTRTQVDQIARELAARSVPVRPSTALEPISQNPLTRAILEISKLALEGNSQSVFRQVLVSSFVGLNAIELRRLERQLVHHFGSEIAQAWDNALETGFEFESREARTLNRVLDLVDKVRATDIQCAHQMVSLVWEFAPANLATLALGHSNVALAANRDLDAVMRLFAAAQRFDQRGGSTPLEFIREQLSLEIAEDSLAKSAEADSVFVTTSSSLAGQSYKVVALPRLQDGIWPNLRPRNSLLGASSLRAYLSGRLANPIEPLKNELSDELRLFYKALGACRGELILSAMRSADEQPSQFFAIAGVELAEHNEAVDFDLRRLTGRLRRRLMEGDASAANLLAGFALAGIPGAHPSAWQGLLEPSTSEPLFDKNEPITLSASSLEAFEQCPLHWFIKTFAVGQTSFQASIGTLLHSAFELAQSPEDVSGYVESNWHTLEFEHSWQSESQKRKALEMAMLASNYLAENPNPQAVEQGFELEFGRLRIRGKIDRIERTSEGLVVADLKTGKTNLDASKNMQLAIYQLAVEQLHPEEKVLGAKLISIGTGKLRESEQSPLDSEDIARLHEAFTRFEEHGNSHFVTANLSDHCAADGNCQLLLAKAVSDV